MFEGPLLKSLLQALTMLFRALPVLRLYNDIAIKRLEECLKTRIMRLLK